MEVLTLILLVAATVSAREYSATVSAREYSATVSAREYSDEELASFPKLFHLDDYERCLAKKDGLYCLGTFDITPEVQPHPTYDLLKEYSDESYRHFNRTHIRRGYCVSSRCSQEAERNTSQSFEACVNKYARTQGLRASINTLHYCQTHDQKQTKQSTTPAQQLFLRCIYTIAAINIIGTIYDVYSGNDVKKNQLITSFSIPANWRRLIAVHEGGDPRLTALTPLNGIRVMAMICSTFAHTYLINYAFYIQNPEYLERLTQRIDGMVLSDGTTLIQALVTMSCFLTGFNLLIYSQKRSLNLSMLPLCIMKRVIRISPVSLLMVGYGATWWIHARGGPLVSSTIGAESRACQSKFWYHVFFVNNMVNPTEYCIAPSWFLAVDMHMYIVSCALTLLMWRQRRAALKLYASLLLASCILNAVVAYIQEYKSMIYLATPEELRVVFRASPSFTELYLSSWGALPSCFLGLILANIQFELNERRINLSEYKWFVYLHYWTFPFIVFLGFTGLFARSYRSNQIFYAVYVALERPLHCILMCIAVLGLSHVDGPLKRFYGWHGFTKMSRLSLTVMLLHWCVNMAITARPVAYSTSLLDLIVDWTSSYFITYLVAVPIALLVEIPMQKFLGLLMF